MYCNHCGKQVSDTAKVCGYCGTRLKPLEEKAPPPPPPPEPAPSPSPARAQPTPKKPVVEVEEVPAPPEEKAADPVPPPAEPVQQTPREKEPPPPIVEQPKPTPPPPPKAKPVVKAPKEKKPFPRWARWVIGLILAIGVNYLFGYIYARGFPLGFDFVGTVVITLVFGPLAGLLAAVSLPVLAWLTYFDQALYFIPVHVFIMLLTWGMHQWGWFKNIFLTLLGSAMSVFVLNPLAAIPSILVLYYPPSQRNIDTILRIYLDSLNWHSLALPIIFLLVWAAFLVLPKKDR